MKTEATQLNLFELPEELLPRSFSSSFPFIVVESRSPQAEPREATAEQDRLLTAFTYAMDFYNTAKESAWLSCFYQDNPEVTYERFRLGVAGLLKQGLVAVEERNCGGEHYSLTHAGLLACPEGGDPHNTKRPHGWTEEDENRLTHSAVNHQEVTHQDLTHSDQ